MQLFDILQMSNSRKCIERRLAVGNVRYLVSGDCAVTVEFGNEISPEINRKIRAFKIALEKEQIEGIVETVPTYRSLLVVYKPEVIRFSALTEKFEKILSSMGSIQIPPPTVIEIPVFYGGEMGPDLANVAEHNGLTEEEVVMSLSFFLFSSVVNCKDASALFPERVLQQHPRLLFSKQEEQRVHDLAGREHLLDSLRAGLMKEA